MLLVCEWDVVVVVVGDLVPVLAASVVRIVIVVGGREAAEEFGEDAFVAHDDGARGWLGARGVSGGDGEGGKRIVMGERMGF